LDRLETIGYLVDRLADILLAFNEKRYDSLIKPFYEMCMVSKVFMDEKVTHFSFSIFVRLLYFMNKCDEAI
jgi:hypothetical protein